ncbi:MAG: helix-turn-helix domain-containing protein [Oscillospiraceae bacterium]|jgi:transcriptional regulator with XRE-family HTH domain|nr:helix-turn-helix domain-containing protein [Oscillospiraceae bacterium]
MLYLAENLKSLRKGKDLTQEEISEILGVSPQSVSKWERGETFPDITLLPALANLYKVSVDALIGMDKINDWQTRTAIFTTAHKHWRNGDINSAIDVFSDALKTFPNDEGIMSDLAMALALCDDTDKLSQAVALCERVLSGSQGDKVHHTTRAALCFIYLKVSERDKAIAAARKLPHLRESREMILTQMEKDLSADEINSYLKFIAIGENDEQDVIEVDFGIDMVAVCTEYDLLGKIEALRVEVGAPKTTEGFRVLPQIRIRDKVELAPYQVRVRRYADYLLDKTFDNQLNAANEIIEVLRSIVQG